MSCILTIDQGNSSAKVTLFDDSVVLWKEKFDTLSIESLDEILSCHHVRGAIYCSVAGQDAKLIESLRLLLNENVLVLTHETQVPIEIDYHSKESLGVDRIALAVGASSLCLNDESVLVVDLGTAITIDLLIGGHRFNGGNISPGMGMRFMALNHYTERLPLVNPRYENAPFGSDTESAIRCGVEWGVVYEISASFDRAASLCGVSRCFVTGGDAELISKMLAAKEVEHIPDLMAVGLKRIFEYNENI